MSRTICLWITSMLLLATACTKQVKPQAPANQPKQDTVAELGALLNMRLAEEAEKQCTAFVQTLDTTFVLSEYGFWYTLTHRTDAPAFRHDDKVEVYYQAYTFQGALIEDVQTEMQIGHRDALLCFDLLFPTLHQGETVTLVTPYYMAYGREGTASVPALTNCVIKVSQISLIK